MACAQSAPTQPAATNAQSASAQPTGPNDYSNQADWLCLPGVKGACDTDLDTSVISESGRTSIEKFERASDPPADCFYVYPTVSQDPGVVSDMTAKPEEILVVSHQFERFGAVCRTFAPLYRQFTLTALVAYMSGKPLPNNDVDPNIGYNDIVDAWHYYLNNYNKDRPFVLVGHSQGSGVLIKLIKNEIDGEPIEKRMLSAILMGSRLQVATGKDVGGDFRDTPLCHSPQEIGCAISYNSFRASAPPGPDSLFGESSSAGLETACVNPAAPGGGTGEAHSYFDRGGSFNGTDYTVQWLKNGTIDTPFVSTPGLITAQCMKSDNVVYLGVTLHGNPNSPRTSDIKGYVVIGGKIQPQWGLHLIDSSLFQGNLIDIVRSEENAYANAKH
jgi:hypothetical protein